MQSISPEIIFRGNDAWEESLPQITKLTKRPLILGKSKYTHDLRNKIFLDLKNHNVYANNANLHFDCCDEDISRELRALSQTKIAILLSQLEGGKFLILGNT